MTDLEALRLQVEFAEMWRLYARGLLELHDAELKAVVAVRDKLRLALALEQRSKDWREDQIADWLRGRGFVVTRTTGEAAP